jgi:multidrug efflux system membrane fusion protein
LLCASLTAGCAKTQGAPTQGQGGPGGGPGGARTTPVKTGPVQVMDVVYRIQALGSLEADELIQITAEVDGALAEVRFREGDRIAPDTVIARIDPDRYRLEAARAEANYQKAVADQARAQADFDRREKLAKDSLLSQEELSRSRTENEGLAAQAAAAKAARDIAVQNVSRANVTSRHVGVIDKRLVDTGQFVRAGTVLANLVDTSRLKLRFKVSEGESLRARAGQSLAFKVGPIPDREFKGEIYHVGEVADPATRQVEVLAWVRNPGVLKPGFFAEITLASESKKGALVIPETAVQASERGFVAFAVEDGKARVRPVQIGLRTGGGNVEILAGLKPGETVIYEGSDRLADGVAVRDASGGGAPGPGGRPRRGGATADEGDRPSDKPARPGAAGHDDKAAGGTK